MSLSKMNNAQLRNLVTALQRENEALSSENTRIGCEMTTLIQEKMALTKRLADIRDGEDRVLARLDETLRRLPGISLKEPSSSIAGDIRRNVKQAIISALWDKPYTYDGELRANKIEAIKVLRAYDNSYLKEAKDRVEALMGKYPTRQLLEHTWLNVDNLFL